MSVLQAELSRQNIVSKAWVSGSGRKKGGVGYSRGALYYLLRNALYAGRITHRGATYDGQHPAILPKELWDQVQVMLTQNRQGNHRTASAAAHCLLAGRLFDDRGHIMTCLATITTTSLAVVFVGITSLLQPVPKLIWNASASVPIGLYAVTPTRVHRVGELVVVRPPEALAAFLGARGYLARGAPLLKHIAALPGQFVCRTGPTITIDGVTTGQRSTAITSDECCLAGRAASSSRTTRCS